MSNNKDKSLWHGRFSSAPADILMEYTASIEFDRVLALHDIKGSVAHIKGLAASGILNKDEVVDILSALDQTEKEFESDSFVFVESDEDIHTAIERRVTEIAGEVGAKLHTGRSRNDQVATAYKLWVKDALSQVAKSVIGLKKVLVKKSEELGEAIMPGYTHLQRAQPVPVAHYLLAHAWVLKRDFDRVLSAIDRIDSSPLGAGALAGSSLNLDPVSVSSDLGFSSTFDNSIDATSANDYVCEALFVCSLIGVHLSRVGEEFIIMSSQEFGFVELDDAYSTGSSMMPQKKNPDIAETVRGKAGRLIGNLTGFLATYKGLPFSYNKDLQENKEPLFDSVKQIVLGLKATSGMIETATFNTDVMLAATQDENLMATDLAEILVSKGIPFRRAHEIIGGLVGQAHRHRVSLKQVVSEDSNFDSDDLEVFDPLVSVRRRATHGGASFSSVAKQLEGLKAQIKTDELRLKF